MFQPEGGRKEKASITSFFFKLIRALSLENFCETKSGERKIGVFGWTIQPNVYMNFLKHETEGQVYSTQI